jgi:hypothetical protein
MAFLRKSDFGGLPPAAALWERPLVMTATRFLRFLFASLISIGLAIAPLSTLAVAADRPSEAGMMQVADMSSDMPCCPEKQKQSDCQDCPLVAICLLKVLQSGPSLNGLPVRDAISQALQPRNEPAIAGFVGPPPDQPPRMIV